KVFCDVIDLDYAKKVEAQGADAVIAVNNRAGGHAGKISPKDLVTLLTQNCTIPVISAGGVAHGKDIKDALDWGAAGVSVGTIFIACEEADISQEYKQAMVDYGEKDIVMSTKLSGSALTVINTPYVQQMGTKANFLERLLNKNKTLKKYVKMLIAYRGMKQVEKAAFSATYKTAYRGMKQVEKAAFSATYKTVWCAGPAIEHVHSIRPMAEIVTTLTSEYKQLI
ncbi:MAG: nitronate monooxygenase, partial [Cyclobacteriaceae bacterium]|nr:nitronate monooxygenase [Cyclobacteriaceae bacterium]